MPCFFRKTFQLQTENLHPLFSFTKRSWLYHFQPAHGFLHPLFGPTYQAGIFEMTEFAYANVRFLVLG